MLGQRRRTRHDDQFRLHGTRILIYGKLMCGGSRCGPTEYVVNSWEECCFEKTNQESIRCQLRKRVDSVLEQREDAPGHVEERNQVEHRDTCKKVHERQLTNYRADHIHRLEAHQLVTLKSQVFFETGDIGIVFSGQPLKARRQSVDSLMFA